MTQLEADDAVMPRLLFVDDEPNLLSAIDRLLGFDYEITTCTSGEEALALLPTVEPFDVITSDMRMPGMDGATFLTRVSNVAPSSIRMLLTGQSDAAAAASAVNDGKIFRFLCKPCPEATLRAALDAALTQKRLESAERELLERTVHGTIRLVGDVLAIVSPKVFDRAEHIRVLVGHMADIVAPSEKWKFEAAALLADLGCIALPTPLVDKALLGTSLGAEERDAWRGHPEIAGRLLASIPRLEDVSEIARRQRERSAEKPADAVEIGIAMLHVAAAVDAERAKGVPLRLAIGKLRDKATAFERHLYEALLQAPLAEENAGPIDVRVRDLVAGMIAVQGVRTNAGAALLGPGQQITAIAIERIKRFAMTVGIEEPIKVEPVAG